MSEGRAKVVKVTRARNSTSLSECLDVSRKWASRGRRPAATSRSPSWGPPLFSVVAAFAEAEIEAGTNPGVPGREQGGGLTPVLIVAIAQALVGTNRLAACMDGEDPVERHTD